MSYIAKSITVWREWSRGVCVKPQPQLRWEMATADKCECGCQHLCPQEALETARREDLTLAIKRNAPTDGRNAYLGVFPVKSQVHGWLARYGTGGSLRNLGTFRWPEEAALAIARDKRDKPVAHGESTESEASSHAPPGRKRKSGAENRGCKKPAASHDLRCEKPAASHKFSEESVRHSSGALAGSDADTEQRDNEQTKFCAVPVRESQSMVSATTRKTAAAVGSLQSTTSVASMAREKNCVQRVVDAGCVRTAGRAGRALPAKSARLRQQVERRELLVVPGGS